MAKIYKNNLNMRFNNLTYEDFKAMAQDKKLSRYEKVGFPDTYRAGKEIRIFKDIESKLPSLKDNGSVTMDIGCGCSDIPHYMIERARQKSQTLVLVDSKEMLDQLPDDRVAQKIPTHFPDCPELLEHYAGYIDAIIAYSVIQYVFVEGNLFDFLDKSLTLLAPQGRMLIGDIPNLSMRKRFFKSDSGITAHRQFKATDEYPPKDLTHIEKGSLDDSVVMSLLKRARLAGFHSYIVPQAKDLPMANRREDILIIRP